MVTIVMTFIHRTLLLLFKPFDIMLHMECMIAKLANNKQSTNWLLAYSTADSIHFMRVRRIRSFINSRTSDASPQAIFVNISFMSWASCCHFDWSIHRTWCYIKLPKWIIHVGINGICSFDEFSTYFRNSIFRSYCCFRSNTEAIVIRTLSMSIFLHFGIYENTSSRLIREYTLQKVITSDKMRRSPCWTAMLQSWFRVCRKKERAPNDWPLALREKSVFMIFQIGIRFWMSSAHCDCLSLLRERRLRSAQSDRRESEEESEGICKWLIRVDRKLACW